MIVFKYKPIQTLNSIMISSSSSGDSPAHSRSDLDLGKVATEFSAASAFATIALPSL